MTIDVREVALDPARDLVHEIRRRVFVEEQGVPEELEFDEADAASTHVAAFRNDAAVGTGRITAEGKIGRMAVLPEHRRRGVGRALLDALVEIAVRDGVGEITLSAQQHAIGFYEKAGFVAEGPVYEEAGIPHRRMRRALEV